MCTFAGILRSIHPRMVGLVRRSLLVAGLLFGFLLAGSALAHAETEPPPPIPVLGVEPVQLPDVPDVSDVPALSDTIFSAQQAIASVPKVVTPVTKVVTSLTTDVTTAVVRTVNPVVRPAVGVTTPVLKPVLAPLLSPPPVTSRPTAKTQPATPDVDPITDALVAQPVSAQPATVPTTTPIPVVQPQVLPVDLPFVPAISSAPRLSAAPSPRVPLDDDGPIVDVTGGNSTCGSNPTGPMFGVSRSFFGPFADRLVGTGVRPGTGPPKWWFFDPHHHPS